MPPYTVPSFQIYIYLKTVAGHIHGQMATDIIALIYTTEKHHLVFFSKLH